MTRMPAQPLPRTSAGRTALEARLAELEHEREKLIREKRRNLLFAGAAVSLVIHMIILWYLGLIIRSWHGAGMDEGIGYEFAIVTDEELSGLMEEELESGAPESLSELADAPEGETELNLDAPPGAELNVSGEGSDLSLGGGGAGSGAGGGGGGDGLGLGGGGGSATFHGVEGKGNRFLYIVDISGSMTESNRFRLAMAELIRSISSLPDFAHFHVVLYETEIHWPAWQEGWMRARVRYVDRLVQWLEGISPGGGTQPTPAFQRAFALDVPPDVIFFLSDGIIPAEAPAEIAQMNGARGKRVIINTIAFGDASGQDLLRQVAEDSGGVFKFVPVGDPP